MVEEFQVSKTERAIQNGKEAEITKVIFIYIKKRINPCKTVASKIWVCFLEKEYPEKYGLFWKEILKLFKKNPIKSLLEWKAAFLKKKIQK